MRGLCFRTRSCARSSRRRVRWRTCTATCSTTSSSTWTSTAPTTSCCARSTASRWSRSGCPNTGSIPTTCDVIDVTAPGAKTLARSQLHVTSSSDVTALSAKTLARSQLHVTSSSDVTALSAKTVARSQLHVTSSSRHWVPKQWLDPNYMWRRHHGTQCQNSGSIPNYMWRHRLGTGCQNSGSIPNYMWRHRLGTGCQNSGSIKITCDVVVMAPSAETVARSQLHVMSSQHRVHIGNLTVIKFQWMWTALLFSRECR